MAYLLFGLCKNGQFRLIYYFAESASDHTSCDQKRHTKILKLSPMNQNLEWHKVLDQPSTLPEGRVMTVTVENTTYCLTHHQGTFACLDNKCPHQGGPLGEGSIENGYLRCPWHGWDYDPITGKAPGGYDDGIATFPTEVREDGLYIGLPAKNKNPERSISDVVAETLTNWGLFYRFWNGGPF